jgi:hypothetical protein
MNIYQVLISTGEGKPLLRNVTLHVNDSERGGQCILWDDDCEQLKVNEAYQISLQDGRSFNCVVASIHPSVGEQAETLELDLTPRR